MIFVSPIEEVEGGPCIVSLLTVRSVCDIGILIWLADKLISMWPAAILLILRSVGWTAWK